jgi:hypothetical protein
MDSQHDPRTKQQLKDMLYHYLYDPVERRFKERLDSIIRANSIAVHSGYDCFSYKSKVYMMDERYLPPRQPPRLDKSLVPTMDLYLAELAEVNDKEMPFVLGFITQVLNSSDNLHDYIRALPPSVHKPLKDIIAQCGCKTASLSELELQNLLIRNTASINLMKQRMVLNLLL